MRYEFDCEFEFCSFVTRTVSSFFCNRMTFALVS